MHDPTSGRVMAEQESWLPEPRKEAPWRYTKNRCPHCAGKILKSNSTCTECGRVTVTEG